MSLSESERKTLEELEQEFLPTPSPRIPSRWSRTSAPTRVLAAAFALPVGLAIVLLGLVLNNVSGVALAAVAYMLMVGSATFLVDRRTKARAALGQPRREGFVARANKYFP